MTPEELKHCNGRDGNPAYVAVSGVIYDVSASALWPEGNHEGAHQAGEDLTEELKSAPHVRAVIERFPVVGQLQTAAAAKPQAKKTPVVPLVILAVILIVVVIILAL